MQLQLEKQPEAQDCSATGRAIDVVRAIVGSKFDRCHPRGYNTPSGRVARACMQLERSRSQETPLGGVSFFDDHHARLYAPSNEVGSPGWMPRELWVDSDARAVRFKDGTDVLTREAARCCYDPLAKDALFHLAFCGGVRVHDEEKSAPSFLPSSIFIGLDRRCVTLRALWPEFLKIARPSNLLSKRSGDEGEVYLTLALLSASHMKGLAAQPHLDDFTCEAVLQMLNTSVKRSSHTHICSEFLSSFNKVFPPLQESYPKVPFASPVNTSWPVELAKTLRGQGVYLGNAVRPPDSKELDFVLEDHVVGESKNRKNNINADVLIASIDKMPDDFHGVHFFATQSSLASFRTTAGVDASLIKRSARAAKVVKGTHGPVLQPLQSAQNKVLGHSRPQALFLIIEFGTLGFDVSEG